MVHNLISSVYLRQGKACAGFQSRQAAAISDPLELAKHLALQGTDVIIIYDFSENDAEHDAAIDLMREIADAVRIPIWAGGSIHRVEDVKKILYAGCAKALLNASVQSNAAMLEEVSKRFGKEKIGVIYDDLAQSNAYAAQNDKFASVVVLRSEEDVRTAAYSTPIVLRSSGTIASIEKAFTKQGAHGVSGKFLNDTENDFTALKLSLRRAGVTTTILETAIPWSEFKTNDQGLVPCIVQDARTDDVLMMAWMNEESYERTLHTGRMTYYSRSRSELWLKGETSGHFQYVKSLAIDCDKDTILAKVDQVGAACHTGNRSCFYTELADKHENVTNPYRVFEDVMNVILDRKVNPKEGSYTNYLFNKGIDKILKKVGEECTEIIIAAKNPNPEEIKYEIADYLYHLMVLMAERGVTWEEITEELARR